MVILTQPTAQTLTQVVKYIKQIPNLKLLEHMEYKPEHIKKFIDPSYEGEAQTVLKVRYTNRKKRTQEIKYIFSRDAIKKSKEELKAYFHGTQNPAPVIKDETAYQCSKCKTVIYNNHFFCDPSSCCPICNAKISETDRITAENKLKNKIALSIKKDTIVHYTLDRLLSLLQGQKKITPIYHHGDAEKLYEHIIKCHDGKQYELRYGQQCQKVSDEVLINGKVDTYYFLNRTHINGDIIRSLSIILLNLCWTVSFYDSFDDKDLSSLIENLYDIKYNYNWLIYDKNSKEFSHVE